jgi:hypothetical protein
MCKKAGVELAYLPPYSPDFNPIELAFGRLKMWYKKHMQVGILLKEDFESFIRLGLESQIESAAGFFRKSQIGSSLKTKIKLKLNKLIKTRYYNIIQKASPSILRKSLIFL